MIPKHYRVEILTLEAIKQYVPEYKFRWMRNTGKQVGRAGQCSWTKKEISLSAKYVELNSMTEIRNTILHEIAHALRPKHGHNKFWRKTALEIGCNGSRTYSNNVVRN